MKLSSLAKEFQITILFLKYLEGENPFCVVRYFEDPDFDSPKQERRN